MRVKELKQILAQCDDEAIIWTNEFYRGPVRAHVEEPLIRVASADKNFKQEELCRAKHIVIVSYD